ncbi:MAG: DUF547 domain-containing protein [Gammaproteobacteria bacterium]
MRRLLPWLLAAWLPCAGAHEPDWSAYRALLGAHVSRGERHGVTLNVVDYAGLRADPRLGEAIAAVETFPTSRLANRDERIAFLVNVYNLYTLALVARHWPLDSIKDIGSLLRPVWKRPAGQLDGKAVTLDEIEHAQLRTLGEPRIHFAIVCASVSCPDLRPEPYMAATLDAQLDDQAKTFLANPAKGLRREADTWRASRIFDWFEDDFEPAGGVAAFIARFQPLPRDAEVDADLPYDWGINARP